MREVQMLKVLGSSLDEDDFEGSRARVRRIVEQTVNEGASGRRPRQSGGRRLVLLVAALVALSLGGIAIAGGFADGAGVGDPPSQKIPFVRARIDLIESELAALDTTTIVGAAKAEALRNRLVAGQAVLDRLCAEAGQPEGC